MATVKVNHLFSEVPQLWGDGPRWACAASGCQGDAPIYARARVILAMTLLCAAFSWILQKAAAEGVVRRLWMLRVCMDVVGVWPGRVVSVSRVRRALCGGACFSRLSIGN